MFPAGNTWNCPPRTKKYVVGPAYGENHDAFNLTIAQGVKKQGAPWLWPIEHHYQRFFTDFL
jgi:hypothetical protein